MRYTWITEKFLPIGEKLGQKGISAARAESISAARFLPGGEKRANTGLVTYVNRVIRYRRGKGTTCEYVLAFYHSIAS